MTAYVYEKHGPLAGKHISPACVHQSRCMHPCRNSSLLAMQLYTIIQPCILISDAHTHMGRPIRIWGRTCILLLYPYNDYTWYNTYVQCLIFKNINLLLQLYCGWLLLAITIYQLATTANLITNQWPCTKVELRNRLLTIITQVIVNIIKYDSSDLLVGIDKEYTASHV